MNGVMFDEFLQIQNRFDERDIPEKIYKKIIGMLLELMSYE
jgi:hypothetical protein